MSHHLSGAFARKTLRSRAAGFRNSAVRLEDLMNDALSSAECSESADDRKCALGFAAIIQEHVDGILAIAAKLEALAENR